MPRIVEKGVVIGLICFFSLFSCVVFADDPPQELANLQAPGDYSASSAEVSGNEYIDPFSGSLTLTYEDMHLAAAGGMDLVITRFYQNLQNPVTDNPYKTSSNGRSMLGTGWDIHFGRVWVYGDASVGLGSFPANNDKTVCKINKFTSAQSPVLELADGSRQALVDIDNGNPMSLRSKNNWMATCLPVTDDVNNVGGLMVYSPDGKKYTFNDYGKVVTHSGYGPIQSTYAYLVTEIQDLAGNKIRISYKNLDGFRAIDVVSTVSAQGTSGPQVTFNYASASQHLLESITGEGLTVTYTHTAFGGYAIENPYHLSSVTLPEGGYTWSYTYYGSGGDGAYSLASVTSPGGMVTTYNYGVFTFSYGILYCGEEQCANVVVTQKSVSGGDVDSSTWNYTHAVSLDANDIAREIHVGISCTEYEYEGEHKLTGTIADLYRRGLLVKKTLSSDGGCSSPIETEEYEYGEKLWIASVNEFRASPQSLGVGTWRPLLTRKTITRDSGSYVTNYSNFTGVGAVGGFDGVPTQVTESGGMSRTTTKTIVDSFSFNSCSNAANCYVWAGRLNAETITASDGTSEKAYTYQDKGAGLPMGRLLSITDNGVTTQYARNSDGDVFQVTHAYGTPDASISYAATVGAFVRGNPTRIDILKGYDGDLNGTIELYYDIRIDRSYDQRGNVIQETRSRTGETSVVTVMTYDGFDRLTSVTTPRTDDQNLFFEYSAGGGYNVTEKRGANATTPSVTTLKHYNAEGALLSEETADNSSGTTLRTRYDVDALNRQVFASFPSTQPLLNINDGVLTSYDNLDRITNVRYQTGGAAEATWTAYSYHPGNLTQIIDERGFKTTQTFVSFGDPDEKFLTKIEQEKVAGGAAVTTTINRNGVGRINNIVQDGVTHSFTYFPTRRMQVETETYPEIGTIKYTRKVSGEVTSQRIFSDAALTTPITDITYFDLDYQRRLVQINYPGTTNDVHNVYDMFNGLKNTLTMTNNTSWSNCFATYGYLTYCNTYYPRTIVSRWNNSYDLNHNLTQEQFNDGSSNYNFDYAYDARDHLRTVTYPNGHVATNTLDNLGRTTAVSINDGAVSNLATGITYFPNGQISSMTLGNGRNASFTQTARKQPQQFSVNGSTLNLLYSYDNVGNMSGVTDSIHSGTRSNLQYDGLNRLTSVKFPGNTTHGFQYNDHGDITQKSVGANNWNYNYGASKKLASISGAEATSFSYDNYGNTITGWGNSYVFDDANQLLSATTPKGSESYQYDGYKRRFRITNNLGSYLTLYNSAGKLMSEIDNNGAGNKRNYVYLNGQLFYHHDNCGTASNVALGVCSWLDEDSDNLTWGDEEDNRTNPHLLDTDGDGFPDPVEIQKGMDPTDSSSATLPLNEIYKGGVMQSTQGAQ